MTYVDAMPVDRLSVTVPSEIGLRLRTLAAARGETVSNLVAEAIAHQIRMAALDTAIAEGERLFGPISGEALAKADAELSGARGKRRRARPRQAGRRNR
jgi:predicted DNA-binding protein